MTKRVSRSLILRQMKDRIDEMKGIYPKLDLETVREQLFNDLKSAYNYTDQTIKQYLKDLERLGYLTYDYLRK